MPERNMHPLGQSGPGEMRKRGDTKKRDPRPQTPAPSALGVIQTLGESHSIDWSCAVG